MISENMRNKTSDLELILLGGSLGTGKTTLLLNLIQNKSFISKKDGLVIMDATGSIDYERIKSFAEKKGIFVENATSACTVCDGPNAAFKKIEELQEKGVSRVTIELTGQMPLSSMKNKLMDRGILAPISIYLLDPKNFALVRAADEILLSDLIGITKRKMSTFYQDLIERYNENKVPIIELDKNTSLSLDELLGYGNRNKIGVRESLKSNDDSVLTTNENKKRISIFPIQFGTSKHTHSRNPNETDKFHARIENPYISTEEFKSLMCDLTNEAYHRIKSYLAIDSNKILEFDAVRGDLEFREGKDSNLGNGSILVANQDGNFFDKAKLENKLNPILKKPETSPVMRIYSSFQRFEEYINEALVNKDFDSAFGAIEQYSFENKKTGNENPFSTKYVPQIIEGKWNFINNNNSQIKNAQKVLQTMAVLYAIETHDSENLRYGSAKNLFIQLYPQVEKDELLGLTDFETFEFSKEMYTRLSKNLCENIR